MRKAVLILAAAGALVWSCGDDDVPPPPTVDQDAGDGGQTGGDGSTNVPELDAGSDAEPDASLDADADADLDASLDAGTDAEADAGATCEPGHGQVCDGGPYNFAFVTSATFATTMAPEEADAKCEELAAAAGIGGKYVAWRSSSTSNARDRLGTASGWLRTDRRPFALDATALFAGDLKYPLVVDENGTVLEEDTIIPTGTGDDGRASGDDCGDWMDSTEPARASGGATHAGSFRWTMGFLPRCNVPSRLYCLGADHANAITLPPPPAQTRRAFVTKGSLGSDAGRDAADALCATEASGLSGTFLALMATSTQAAAARFDVTKPTWFRTDGVPLWPAAAELAADKQPMTVVLRHADGSVASPNVRAWTGASTPSKTAEKNCGDWGGTAGDSHVGFADLVTSWFGGGPLECTTPNVRVYCFEQ